MARVDELKRLEHERKVPRYEHRRSPWPRRLWGLGLFLVAHLIVLLAGVGVYVSCTADRCEHAHRSLWTGTAEHTFAPDDVKLVDTGWRQTRTSGNKVVSSHDPVIELDDGRSIPFYPRRVSPMFQLLEPLAIAHFAAGNGPAPVGGDVIVGLLAALAWWGVGLGAWLVGSLAKHEHLVIDPERRHISMVAGPHALDMSLDQLVSFVRVQGDGPALYVRDRTGQPHIVTANAEHRDRVAEVLAATGFPEESAPPNRLSPATPLFGDNLRRLAVGAAVTMSASALTLAALVMWLVPG